MWEFTCSHVHSGYAIEQTRVPSIGGKHRLAGANRQIPSPAVRESFQHMTRFWVLHTSTGRAARRERAPALIDSVHSMTETNCGASSEIEVYGGVKKVAECAEAGCKETTQRVRRGEGAATSMQTLETRIFDGSFCHTSALELGLGVEASSSSEPTTRGINSGEGPARVVEACTGLGDRHLSGTHCEIPAAVLRSKIMRRMILLDDDEPTTGSLLRFRLVNRTMRVRERVVVK
jgi:hypothetical protein